MKIGVLGGTFDPPHTGHLALARAAIAELELDEVLFIPARRNPLKKGRIQSGAKHRLEMVRLAIEDEPSFSVSDIEIQRAGPSYAVDTLKALELSRPADYWFILGADAVRDFRNWKQPEKLLKLCKLAVAVRQGSLSEDEVRSRLDEGALKRTDFIGASLPQVSSTEIRNRVRLGDPVSHLLPEKVLRFIEANRLYRG